MTDDYPTRRRRRRRASGGSSDTGTPVPSPPATGAADRRNDRADRELAGTGRSQLGVQRAMRARDVNRPDHEDLAAAENDVVIVRRHWTPTT